MCILLPSWSLPGASPSHPYPAHPPAANPSTPQQHLPQRMVCLVQSAYTLCISTQCSAKKCMLCICRTVASSCAGQVRYFVQSLEVSSAVKTVRRRTVVGRQKRTEGCRRCSWRGRIRTANVLSVGRRNRAEGVHTAYVWLPESSCIILGG